jgi:hypothetical protein
MRLLSVLIFWVVTPFELQVDNNVSGKHTVSIFRAEYDGDSMFLRNAGVYLQVYTALQPRRTTSTSSPPWEPQISCGIFVYQTEMHA